MLRLCKKKLIKLLFFTSNNVSFLFNETYDILIFKFQKFLRTKVDQRCSIYLLKLYI